MCRRRGHGPRVRGGGVKKDASEERRTKGSPVRFGREEGDPRRSGLMPLFQIPRGFTRESETQLSLPSASSVLDVLGDECLGRADGIETQSALGYYSRKSYNGYGTTRPIEIKTKQTPVRG